MVRKEVPVAEYETQVQRSAMEARSYRQEGQAAVRSSQYVADQHLQPTAVRSSQYAAAERLSPARVTTTGSRVVPADSVLGQAVARASSPQRFSQAHVQNSPVRTSLNPGRSQFDPAVGNAVDSAVRASIARQNVYGEPTSSVYAGGQRTSGFNATGGTSSFMARSAVGHTNFQSHASHASGFETGERVLDAAVVSRKVAKYDPTTGDIDGEVHQALDRDGRIANAVQKERPGSLYQKDFFE